RFLPGHLIAWSDDHEYPAVALMLEQDCKQPLRLALNIDVIPFGARDGHLGDILRHLRDRLQAKVLFAPAVDIVEQAADRAAEGCYADFGVAGLESVSQAEDVAAAPVLLLPVCGDLVLRHAQGRASPLNLRGL